MLEEIEPKLREVEVAINFFRRRLISSQALRSILIDLYNFLENKETKKGSILEKEKEKTKPGF